MWVRLGWTYVMGWIGLNFFFTHHGGQVKKSPQPDPFTPLPVSLSDALDRYCRIRITSEDKTPRSSLVVGAWRAQVLWVNQAWRVFLISLYSNLFTSGSFRLGGLQRGFSPNSLVSSSITRIGVILCLHFSSLTHFIFIVVCLWLWLRELFQLLHIIHSYSALG